MKIVKFEFETDNGAYSAPLEPDEVVNILTSEFQTVRRQVEVAAELAFFKRTDDSCGPLIRKGAVYLDNGDIHGYPLGRYDQEGDLPFDWQQFVNSVRGQDGFDLIAYLSCDAYAKEYAAILKRLTEGRMQAIGWDRNSGMVVEHGNRKTRSVFAMSEGEIQILKVAAILVDLKMRRYPFQFVAAEMLALLDPDYTERFYKELLGMLQQERQVIFVCRMSDFLTTPLAGMKGIRVVDLDEIKQERGEK